MEQPNIIVFMTDQQLSDTILPGSAAITPNVDRFRRRAVQFTQAYCPAPHCCPSRATFFSGLYPSEHGVWHNVEVCNSISRGLYDDVTLFPKALQQAGYHTIFSGKWHVSAHEGPEDHGFDRVLREYISNYGRMERGYQPHFEDWDRYYSDAADIDGENDQKEWGRIIRPGYPRYHQFGVEENPFGDSDSVRLAVEAVAEHDGNAPFFLYVGATGPHDPYCPPPKYLDLYDIDDIQLPPSFHDPMENVPALYRRTREQFRLTEEEHRESLRRYLAFCSYEDALFGQLLDAVEEKGIADNTVIIYLSDHGDYAGAHGLWAKGLPCYREAYNICCMVGGAGIHRPGRERGAMVSLADFAPPILDLAGVPYPTPYSGHSLMPLLTRAQVPETWRKAIFTQSNGNEVYGIQRAVWTDRWKYVFNSFDYDELYDLSTDPLEEQNRIADPEWGEVAKEMCRRMWSFARQHRDACTCPYVMVGLAPYGPGITVTEPMEQPEQ